MADEPISGLPSYSSIQDIDIVPIVDETLSITKQTTWGNIKSVLQSYFATIFPDFTTAQTLSNKTLSSPVITSPTVTVGSDATGDILYNAGGGVQGRVPAGSDGTVLTYTGGVPSAQPVPSAVNASTSVAGVSQIATAAQITSGTSTGSSGAMLVVAASAVGAPGANKIVQFDGSAKYPSADGSQITNLTNPLIPTNGRTTYNVATASGTQNIAHSLGKIPKKIKMTFTYAAVTTVFTGVEFATYNGTSSSVTGALLASSNTNIISGSNIVLFSPAVGNTNFATGVITFDATNIIITWTQTGSPTGTYNILWEAEA